MCKNNLNVGHLQSNIVNPALDVVVPNKAYQSTGSCNCNSQELVAVLLLLLGPNLNTNIIKYL